MYFTDYMLQKCIWNVFFMILLSDFKQILRWSQNYDSGAATTVTAVS